MSRSLGAGRCGEVPSTREAAEQRLSRSTKENLRVAQLGWENRIDCLRRKWPFFVALRKPQWDQRHWCSEALGTAAPIIRIISSGRDVQLSLKARHSMGSELFQQVSCLGRRVP